MALRILEGRSGVWCQGTSGTLLLPFSHAEDGLLTAEGRAAVARSGIAEERPPRRYSLTVVTATDCNLGCPYCFQNTAPAEPGRFDPPRIPRAVLDDATIEKIAAFTGPRMRSAGTDRLFVLLFGGEPLLNPAACRALLSRLGRLAPVTASMVSNGVLLTPTAAKSLSALGLRSVQVTLDGPRDLHDGLRTTRAGRGTFERIIANLAAAQETTDLRFTLRINTTAAVLPRLADLADQLPGRRRRLAAAALDAAPVLNVRGAVRRRRRPRRPRRSAPCCPAMPPPSAAASSIGWHRFSARCCTGGPCCSRRTAASRPCWRPPADGRASPACSTGPVAAASCAPAADDDVTTGRAHRMSDELIQAKSESRAAQAVEEACR
ncbi:GTP 3',8-cyclase [Streptomyces californicus]